MNKKKLTQTVEKCLGLYTAAHGQQSVIKQRKFSKRLKYAREYMSLKIENFVIRRKWIKKNNMKKYEEK